MNKIPQLKELSPEFDYFDYSKIIDWAKQYNLEVCYSDEFVSNGQVESIPEMGSFALVWDFGVISFDSFKKDEIVKARRAAALFIYMYSRGISASIASYAAESYVQNVTMREL